MLTWGQILPFPLAVLIGHVVAYLCTKSVRSWRFFVVGSFILAVLWISLLVFCLASTMYSPKYTDDDYVGGLIAMAVFGGAHLTIVMIGLMLFAAVGQRPRSAA